MNDVADIRRRYAEELRRKSNVQSDALVRAFATVPREHYLGPGPWLIFQPSPQGMYQPTPDADPIHLYRDVLVAIEPARLLNNGQPSAHALWMDALSPRQGDHVVHIGCGTGYYTAILAEVVGTAGRITALEVDAALAARAHENLAHLPHVRVIGGNGCEHDPGPANGIYVNGGVTHPLPLWLDRLRLDGRLILPLVRWSGDPREASASGAGVLVKIQRSGEDYIARIVSLVSIFPCIGAVDVEADRCLKEAFAARVDAGREYRLRRSAHERQRTCWLHGTGYCLSE